GDGNTAREVGGDAGTFEAHSVHKRATEEGSEEGEGGDRAGDAGLRGTAGGLENEPRHGQRGEHRADGGHAGGEKEGGKGEAIVGGGNGSGVHWHSDRSSLLSYPKITTEASHERCTPDGALSHAALCQQVMAGGREEGSG